MVISRSIRRILRWLPALLIVASVAALAVKFAPSLTLDSLRLHEQQVLAYRASHPVITAAAFAVLFIGYAALPLPGAEILSISAGALFGLGEGTLLVSFASSVGATIAFLISRSLFRDFVRRRFLAKARMLSQGIEEEGAFYLFALRLTPIVPFFLVNLLMGLTPLRLVTFYWVSQIGMLPATIAYVNAGLQLGHLDATSGILSAKMLLSFAALGLLPLVARHLVSALRRRMRR